MVQKGLLIRESKGYYRATSTIGVQAGVEPFRVQNFRMVATEVGGERFVAPEGLPYEPHVGFVRDLVLRGLGVTPEDCVRVALQIGRYRGKLTFTIRAPLGLDLYGFQFALAWLDAQLEELGICGEVNWRVDRGTELLRDLPGLDMDSLGARCITRGEYEGFIEKVYQKAYGVRREVKLDRVTSLENIEAVLMGGLPTGMLLNASFRSLQSQERAVNIMRNMATGSYGFTGW